MYRRRCQNCFSHLDNQVGRVDRLMNTMLATRDQWMRHIVKQTAPEILRQELETTLTQVTETALKQVEEEVSHTFQDRNR